MIPMAASYQSRESERVSEILGESLHHLPKHGQVGDVFLWLGLVEPPDIA